MKDPGYTFTVNHWFTTVLSQFIRLVMLGYLIAPPPLLWNSHIYQPNYITKFYPSVDIWYNFPSRIKPLAWIDYTPHSAVLLLLRKVCSSCVLHSTVWSYTNNFECKASDAYPSDTYRRNATYTICESRFIYYHWLGCFDFVLCIATIFSHTSLTLALSYLHSQPLFIYNSLLVIQIDIQLATQRSNNNE